MELKRRMKHGLVLRCPLLIVPYGIETAKSISTFSAIRVLLIVPYGIETYQEELKKADKATFNRTLWNWNGLTIWQEKFVDLLLIVPYGIETEESGKHVEKAESFNRTLWNWNNLFHIWSKGTKYF